MISAIPTETLETVAGVPTPVYTYSTYVNGAAASIKTLNNAPVAAAGLYTIVKNANGYYTFASQAYSQTDKSITLFDDTYFVTNSVVVNKTTTTQYYQATWDSTGTEITALAAGTPAISATSTLTANTVYDGSNNALIVIFWYE